MTSIPPTAAAGEFKENKASFLERVAYVLTPSEILEIELAYMLAKDRHHYQTRKEKDKDGHAVRYFEHPRRVALIVMDEYHIYDPVMIKTALGHDLLEDTYMSEALLEKTFGMEACRNIKQLTKIEGEGGAFYDRLKNRGSWQAMFIKLCDRLDNMRTLKDCTSAFQQKQVTDTTHHIYPIVGALLHRCPDDGFKVHVYNISQALQHQVAAIQSLITAST